MNTQPKVRWVCPICHATVKRDERRARKLLGVNQADWRHAKRRAKDGAS